MNDNRRHSKFFKRIFFGGSFTLSKKNTAVSKLPKFETKANQKTTTNITIPFSSAGSSYQRHSRQECQQLDRSYSIRFAAPASCDEMMAGVRAATLSFWGSSALAAAAVVARFVCFKALLKAYKHFTRLGALGPQKLRKSKCIFYTYIYFSWLIT